MPPPISGGISGTCEMFDSLVPGLAAKRILGLGVGGRKVEGFWP